MQKPDDVNENLKDTSGSDAQEGKAFEIASIKPSLRMNEYLGTRTHTDPTPSASTAPSNELDNRGSSNGNTETPPVNSNQSSDKASLSSVNEADLAKMREKARVQQEAVQRIKKAEEKLSLQKEIDQVFKDIAQAKHNSKSAYEVAEKLSKISAKIYHHLQAEDIANMNDVQKSVGKYNYNQARKDPTKLDFYSNYILGLANAIAANSPVLESEKKKEGKETLRVGNDNEIFETQHFWYEVANELRKRKDDFTLAIVFQHLKNYLNQFKIDGKIDTLEKFKKPLSIFSDKIEIQEMSDIEYLKKMAGKYLNKYPDDAALSRALSDYLGALTENVSGTKAIATVIAGVGRIPTSEELLTINAERTISKDKSPTQWEHELLIFNYKFILFKEKFLEEQIKKLTERLSSTTSETEKSAIGAEINQKYKEAMTLQEKKIEMADKLINESDFSSKLQYMNNKIEFLKQSQSLLTEQAFILSTLRNTYLNANVPNASNMVGQINQDNKDRITNLSKVAVHLSEAQKNLESLRRLMDPKAIEQELATIKKAYEEYRIKEVHDLEPSKYNDEFNRIDNQLISLLSIASSDEFKKNDAKNSSKVYADINEFKNSIVKNHEQALELEKLISRNGMNNEIKICENRRDEYLKILSQNDPESIKNFERAMKGLEIIYNRAKFLTSILEKYEKQITEHSDIGTLKKRLVELEHSQKKTEVVLTNQEVVRPHGP